MQSLPCDDMPAHAMSSADMQMMHADMSDSMHSASSMPCCDTECECPLAAASALALTPEALGSFAPASSPTGRYRFSLNTADTGKASKPPIFG